jgi:hypothetical protein
MTHHLRRVRQSLVWLLSGMGLGTAPYAYAVDDLVTIDIGGYRFNANTDIAVSGPNLRGTSFRAERAGTPENDTVGRLDATFRPFERHRIRLVYFNSSREGSRTLDRDISFFDRTIPAGATASLEFRQRRVELDYLYSFWKSDSTEAALSLGVHSTRLGLQLNVPQRNFSREASANGPLPMIGLAGTTRPTQNLELLGDVYGMSAKVGDFDGSAVGYRIGARYFVTRHFALGAAWTGIKYNFDLTRPSWQGQLDATNNGGELFVTVRF